MSPFGRILYWLFLGSRGGESRKEILRILSRTPLNLNRLAARAGLDYKTAEHHVRVLSENGVIDAVGSGYGRIFVPSEKLEGEKELLGKILGEKNRNGSKK